MRFAILGPVEVRRGGHVLSVGSGRQRFVLATLLLNADRLTAVDRLIDALWEDPPSSAKAQLHNMISNLRRRLGGEELIVSRPFGYELRMSSHELDVVEFRTLVKRGRQAVADGDHRRAVALLSEAASLWRGPALADVPDKLADGVREPLHEERLSAAEAQLDAELTLGRYDNVLRELAGLLSEHPYRERLHEIQMIALAGAGRSADALEAYKRTYRRFVEDLGVEPWPQLRDLEQRILRGEVPTKARLSARRVTPCELPPAAAILTGREKLIGAVSDALRRTGDTAPAVAVLVGPGGVGKTAAAIECAHRLADAFPDGQLYTDLRGVHGQPADPHAVVGRFLRALGVDGAELPEDRDERVAMYRSRLAGGRTLVVLDDAASEEQVRPLVPGGAGCAALVTSRRQLGGLVGANRWTVPVLAPADAMELFARIVGRDRVAVDPEAATEIVDTCGRLPLATCIAAARLAARPDWTLDEFRRRLVQERTRLDELSVGDLDVRTSIGLSYRTLGPLARRLFRRLGLVAAPDWPAWVADALIAEPAAHLLDQLADAHLVEPVGHDAVGQSRLRLHDLVADFARERAIAEDHQQARADAQSRLLSGWLALATEADERIPHDLVRAPHMETPPPPPSAAFMAREMPSEWFEVERRSLVLAVDQACRLGLADLAGALSLRVCGFLGLRSYDDWESTLRQAVSFVREHGSRPLLVRLLNALFMACARRDRYAELPVIAAEELAEARLLDEPEPMVQALRDAGIAAALLCRFDEAIGWYEGAVRAARLPDVDRLLLRRSLDGLAFTHMLCGHPERALPLFEEALAIDRACGTSLHTVLYLYHYGTAQTVLGRLVGAELSLAEALQISREMGHDHGVAYLEQALADVDIRRRRWSAAADRLDRARQVHEKIGEGDGLAETLRSTGDLAAAEGRLADAITWMCRALDIWRRIDSRVEMARTLARLERAHAAAGEQDAAESCRREYRTILAELNLDDACLYLPHATAAGLGR